MCYASLRKVNKMTSIEFYKKYKEYVPDAAEFHDDLYSAIVSAASAYERRGFEAGERDRQSRIDNRYNDMGQ
jgi:hypothetical protein